MTSSSVQPTEPQSPQVVKAQFIPKAYFRIGLKLLIIAAVVVVALVFKDRLLRLLPPAKTEPWSHAKKLLQEQPSAPSKSQLVELFLNSRQAMSTNSNTETYLSSEMNWIAQNKVETTGKTRDELPVNHVLARDPKEYFHNMLSTFPDDASISFGDVLIGQGSDDDYTPEFYIEDQSTKELKKFVVTRWRYWASLPAAATLSDGEVLDGEVRFVFENNAWKYHFENWLVK